MENKGCCKEKPADNACSTEKTGACGDKPSACGGKSQCCPGTILKGALAGGVVMFIWFAVSWTALLPWHNIQSFSNEPEVAMLLGHVTQQPGIYVLPRQEDGKGLLAVSKPYAFVSVFPDGASPGDMKKGLIKDFLFCLFGAALLTKVLKKRREGCCPVAGSLLIGLLVGAFSYLPNVIWFHFPLQYSLAGLADDVIAITLAGAVIGRFVLKSAGGCACGGKCPCCAGGGCTGKCAGKCPCPCCSGKGSCGDKAASSCGDKKAGCS